MTQEYSMEELENARLQQRIVQLEHTLEEYRQQVDHIQNQQTETHNKLSLLQTLLDTIPSPVFYKDTDGRYQDCNHLFAAQIFGLPKEHIVGKNLQELSHMLPPDLKQVYQGQDEQLINEPGSQVYEAQVRCSDGNRHDFLFSKATFVDHDGEILGIVGVMMDITERRTMEKELRTFYAIAANNPAGVAVITVNGVITYANAAFCRMYGYEHEPLGRAIADFYCEQEQEKASTMIHHVFQEQAWHDIGTYQRKDGSTFPVKVTALLIRNDEYEPHAIALIHRDITKDIEREEELRQSQQEIIDAQRNAIRQLGTPMLPLAPGIIAMPLIGSIDSSRLQQIIEALLEGIARYQAEVAIVDITGIQTVDEQIANGLVQAAQGGKLLGAKIILSGIGPAMAQTFVMLEANVSGIETRGTLQAAIQSVLKESP